MAIESISLIKHRLSPTSTPRGGVASRAWNLGRLPLASLENGRILRCSVFHHGRLRSPALTHQPRRRDGGLIHHRRQPLRNDTRCAVRILWRKNSSPALQ
jgi:hypothetical protein